jgi:hypothetical protein
LELLFASGDEDSGKNEAKKPRDNRGKEQGYANDNKKEG